MFMELTAMREDKRGMGSHEPKVWEALGRCAGLWDHEAGSHLRLTWHRGRFSKEVTLSIDLKEEQELAGWEGSLIVFVLCCALKS